MLTSHEGFAVPVLWNHHLSHKYTLHKHNIDVLYPQTVTSWAVHSLYCISRSRNLYQKPVEIFHSSHWHTLRSHSLPRIRGTSSNPAAVWHSSPSTCRALFLRRAAWYILVFLSMDVFDHRPVLSSLEHPVPRCLFNLVEHRTRVPLIIESPTTNTPRCSFHGPCNFCFASFHLASDIQSNIFSVGHPACQ